MIEDRLLIWKFKRGQEDAACRIYEKYKDYLLTLAAALLYEKSRAEDVVHSVFVSLVQGIGEFELKGSLKGYLGVCVSNCARNVNKAQYQRHTPLDDAPIPASGHPGPDEWSMMRDEYRQLAETMLQLPYEQREVIVLHLTGGMKFKAIADLQNVSIHTVQSRYRLGLKKLRSLFTTTEVT